MQALLRACPDLTWKNTIYVAFAAGLRRGEVVNPKWDDVDFKALEIHVAAKADTPSTWRWTPKDIDRRTVRMTEALANLLAKLKLKAAPANPYALIAPESYRYIQERRAAGTWGDGKRRKPPEVANNVLRDFQVICKAASVPIDEFHSLRKSCITSWLEGGVPPHEIQTMASHASIETTMRYYSTVDKSAMVRVRDVPQQYAPAIVA